MHLCTTRQNIFLGLSTNMSVVQLAIIKFAKWTWANKDKTLMDKVTASDIAYSIIVYENTKEVWEEEILIKASDKMDE